MIRKIIESDFFETAVIVFSILLSILFYLSNTSKVDIIMVIFFMFFGSIFGSGIIWGLKQQFKKLDEKKLKERREQESGMEKLEKTKITNLKTPQIYSKKFIEKVIVTSIEDTLLITKEIPEEKLTYETEINADFYSGYSLDILDVVQSLIEVDAFFEIDNSEAMDEHDARGDSFDKIGDVVEFYDSILKKKRNI